MSKWINPTVFGAIMKIEVFESEAAVADRAASIIAETAREAEAARGRFVFAVSGGRTPWVMLHALAAKDVPWPVVELFQVDERVAPKGDPDRNLTHLDASFLSRAPLQPQHIHAMPVEGPDLLASARSYASTLQAICGTPPALDLLHLGLGPDGHTASLVPDDPVLEVSDRFVSVTGIYPGRRRMTLTYPALDCARRILSGSHGRGQGGRPRTALLRRPFNSRRPRPPGRRVDCRGSSGDREAQGGEAVTVKLSGIPWRSALMV